MTYADWVGGVKFTPDLDGGGRLLAPVFEAALRGRKFKRCFEWCAGPAWIGLWLLENGICEELVTGDINPDAVEAVRSGNWPNVTACLADNLEGIDGRFDLVVANPPNYCDIQPAHPFGFMRDDLRPSDIGWKAHRKFYATVRDHLTDDAEVWISEVEPFEMEVKIMGSIYDKRPRVPMDEFMDMLDGLHLEKIVPYSLGTVQMALLKMRAI